MIKCTPTRTSVCSQYHHVACTTLIWESRCSKIPVTIHWTWLFCVVGQCVKLRLLTGKENRKWPPSSHRIQLQRWCFLPLSRNFLKIRDHLCILFLLDDFSGRWRKESNTNWDENSPCVTLIVKIECIENNCQDTVQIIYT